MKTNYSNYSQMNIANLLQIFNRTYIECIKKPLYLNLREILEYKLANYANKTFQINLFLNQDL